MTLETTPPRVYTVRARNTATTSANKIHDDNVARRFGFSGGLVPGVTTFGYITHPVVEHFGLEWLERGTMTARFVHPVYDGDEIRVIARPDSEADVESLALEATISSGIECAVGAATLPPMPVSIDINAYAAATLPPSPPDATPESFTASPTLGSVEGRFSAGDSKAFLDLIDENLPLYIEKRIAHPGWLLIWANLALTSNFRLGPWIHTSSEVQWLSPANDGDQLATRGKVVRTFERKGHQFVELDVVLVAGSARPVMQVRHVAIYKPHEVPTD